VIVDSVQTMRSASSTSAAGSVGQIRDSTALFVQLAKASGTDFSLIKLVSETMHDHDLFCVSDVHFSQEAWCCWRDTSPSPEK
jgi:hypothetical protein